MYAGQNGDLQVAELLLKEGADPNVHNENGWTTNNVCLLEWLSPSI